MTQAANRSYEYAPMHGVQLALLTVAVALATFMEVLDMTIVNVSIPAIAGSLGVSPNEGTWAVSSYSLAAAIMQPLTGWIGRRFGEVRTFLVSMLLFLLSSALCGLAISMHMLVACRLLQGFVSGPMVAIAQALLLRNYPVEKRGMAMGLWAMVVITAPIFGPILGGYITEQWSWPWIFYINLPVGAFSLILTWSLLKDRESKIVKVPIDVMGLVLLVVGVGCLQYMLDNGNDKDWFGSAEILTAGIVSVMALTYLIVWEMGDKHPILDLHLFRQRNFLVGSVSICLGYFAFFGVNILFPLWLQTTVGYTSDWTGLAVAPIGILALFMAPLIGKNTQRLNLQLCASIAFVIFAAAMFWYTHLNETASFLQLAGPRFFQGIGVPLFFLPLNQIMMSGIKPNELASASGLSNFLRTLAGSLSTAITIWLWTDRTQFHQATLSEHVSSDAAGWQQTHDILSAQGWPGAQQLAYVSRMISQQASTLAVNDLYLMFGIMFLLLVPIVWFAKPPFKSSGGPSH